MPLNPNGARRVRKPSTLRPIRSASTASPNRPKDCSSTVREQIKALEEQIRIDPGDYPLPPRPTLPEPEIAVEPDGLPLIDSAWSWPEQSAPVDRLKGLRRDRRMTPDLDQARRFLTLLDEEAPAFSFQTATDDPNVKASYPIGPDGKRRTRSPGSSTCRPTTCGRSWCATPTARPCG